MLLQALRPPVLRALSHHQPRKEQQAQLVRQLLLLQWRSRDVLKEFAEFYCVRLLLDEQSPLASYFIDLFSQLEWILLHLSVCEFDTLFDFVTPALNICRLLYAAYRMLPKSRTFQASDEQRENQRAVEATEFKRVGRHDRRFSLNELHCRIRRFGFVNLDRQGPSVVSLKEKLGEGGFATVYKGVFKAGRDSRIAIGDPVAVKMFSNGNSDAAHSTEYGSNFGSRLLQSMEHLTQHQEQHQERNMSHDSGIMQDNSLSWELRRLVSVRHPNIVTPKGYIGKRPQGECGLVMEAMDESLHDYLEKVNSGSVAPLQELDMLDLMLEIAKGMRFLHECKLIHRDLKPKNILLRFCTDHEDLGCKLLEVKLADFGLTKLCDFAQDGQTAFQGTSCYMAPELRVDSPSQELSYQLDKVDVFSYGTTCFNILIGNPNPLAFAGSVTEFYEIVKTGEWKQWTQAGTDTHLQYFVELIARCWEPEPALRPTFAALCVLLQHAVRCLLSPQSLGNAIDAVTEFSILQDFEKSFKMQYSLVYKLIISNLIFQKGPIVGGLKIIERCFLEFESAISVNLKAEKKQMEPVEIARQIVRGIISIQDYVSEVPGETSDIGKDVSMFLEAMRKPNFNVVKIHAMPQPLQLCELISRHLDELDPLLFIKGQACLNLLQHCEFDTHKRPSILNSLSALYEDASDFDFKSDEAFCDIEVDTSLIPLWDYG